MDIVTDLTAEAVSYITLFQDILKSKSDIVFPKDLIKKSDWKLIKVAELPIKDLTVHQKEKIIDLVWHSPTKDDTDRFVKVYLDRTVSLLHWLSSNIPVNEKIADKSQSGEETNELVLFRPPFFWRQAIRSVLYKQSEKRLKLVEILQYMPLQIILAMAGKGKLGYTIRLYQFYTKLPQEDSGVGKTCNNYDLLEFSDRNLHFLFWSTRRTDAKNYLENDQRLLDELKDQDFSLPFETLFREELIEISKARVSRNTEFNITSKEGDPQRDTSLLFSDKKEEVFDPMGKAGEMQLMGIALSGGGIRSATFNLGILQKLASLNVLYRFDYMSTVSGGGYIGSWFTSWVHRSGSFSKINDRLCPGKSQDPLADEVRPIRWLRMFSNYLSPNVSIMSSDAWTSGMTWLRNTFVNQVILLLSLLTVLSFISNIYSAWIFIKKNMNQQDALHIFCFSFFMFIIGGFLVATAMRSFYNINKKESNKGCLKQVDKLIMRFTWKFNQTNLIPHLLVFWGAISALVISTYFAAYKAPPPGDDRSSLLMYVFSSAFLAFFLVALRGNYHKRWDLMEIGRKNVDTKEDTKDKNLSGQILFAIIGSTLAASALLVFLLMFFWLNIISIYDFSDKVRIDFNKIFLVIGIPIILEIFSLAVILRMALMGNLFPDYRREWWGRMGGYIHRFMLFWMIVSFAALIMPDLWNNYMVSLRNNNSSVWSVVWAWSGWTAIMGWGLKKAFESKDETKTTTKSYITIILKVIPFVFMIGILLIGSWIMEIIKNCDFFSGRIRIEDKAWGNFFVTLILAAITLLLSWRVGVNEFSLHYFYRNRLIRAFLGATRSREDRIKTANIFTGFDANDDLLLSSMQTDNGYFGPFPLINSTLNATVVSALDRQDRMGESFVFSPLYCGYDFSPTRSSTYNIDHVYEYGYRPTDKFSNKKGGPTLGTAMAISGAAINPNWGYHSSATMAFLLTLFNLRLGWWIGNPRLDKWKNPDPNFGLLYLMRDLIGKSDINMEYVCLSDGGHFDNMGLYELVRRRCQYILIGDAEQDQENTCEGLANAIRRCRIDFGVDIDFGVEIDKIKDKTEHIAKGTIVYPGAGKQPGTIIYIKTVITEKESVDVKEYASANKDFPQQSTGDQFFDEAQFESYRKLGYDSIKTISQLYLP
ncbi:patatin-like phospholipase family protein [Flavobacterium sp. JAS]|uniref:patatin-like phospholipase family protein n=1 Tax=Flavobacterium sp. JAS TaxID=2897329 RepID=UPI001E59E0D6|nr:patatin-like phospholipase family protein [Flavobacterium sp. JAS]MCD0471466.1 patatin-like phospholipase family protein [Flavobacterium sp. JAS]